MTSSAFAKIELELIRTQEALEFNLYLNSPDTGRVLIVPKGHSIDQDLKLRLARKKAEIFILNREKEFYRRHLEEGLHRLIRTEPLDETKAAGLAYDLSLQAVEAVFENPDKKTLEEAKGCFETTAELILTKERALFALLELTRNSHQLHVHSANVAIFGLGLARNLIMEGRKINLRNLSSALFFHDLGQISLDPGLIGRVGDLTAEEFAEVREHPAIGRELISEAGFLTPEAAAVIYQHHERLDGSGYPEGRKGEEIDLPARICAIADVYDLLTSDRYNHIHKDGQSAVMHMVQEMPGQLDSSLLRRFIEMFRRAA